MFSFEFSLRLAFKPLIILKIHLFGGNPKQVTIWGQSAGAGSVIQHMIAHGGNTQPPLFHAAMTSSTFLPSQYNFDDPVPEVRTLASVLRIDGPLTRMA